MLDSHRLGALALSLLLVPTVGATPQERLDTRSNDIAYVIRARVDGETKELAGEETITWENRSGEPVSDLWFHLYLNAFSNDRSRHLLESNGRLRGKEIKEGWGWQRVTSIQVGGTELVEGLTWRHPDEPEDAASEDRTVFSVDLPATVEDGESIEIQITWESQLPRVRRRTGYKEDFFFIAQWFPKLAVYEGGRGWNAHQFHANTEFYADYGTFDVTLDLPEEYAGRVGASGVNVSEEVADGRVLSRFLAPSEADRATADHTGRTPRVHDFAWTADPDYVVVEGTFSPEEWKQRFPMEVERAAHAFGADRELGLRTVRVTALIQPERASQAERHIEATNCALFFYGLWFGGYPYEHVTVVDPAWGGRAAGGMEYPTIFTAGSRLFTTPDMYTPESVTVHECGHQFWYGLVGNNEFEGAWLDEGLNSYADSEALWRTYGWNRRTTSYSGIPMDGERPTGRPGGGTLGDVLTGRRWNTPAIPSLPMTAVNIQPLRSSGLLDWWREQPYLTLETTWDDPRWGDRSGYLRDPDSDPIDQWAWLYVDRNSYRTNSYPRPAAALRSLIGVIGYEAFLRGMRNHSETWRYRHPYTDDFFATFSEGAGVDVGWYFEDLFRSTKTVDWQVEVSQREVRDPRGFFQEGLNGPFVEVKKEEDESEEDAGNADEPGETPETAEGDSPAEATAEGEAAEVAEDDAQDEGATDEQWRIEIVVRRKGELRLPLRILLTYTDGTAEELTWTREEQEQSTWLRILRDKNVKLKSAVLDPERLYYIDRNMSDNQWYEETDGVAPLRWAERVLTQYSHLLQWQSGIGG